MEEINLERSSRQEIQIRIKGYCCQGSERGCEKTSIFRSVVALFFPLVQIWWKQVFPLAYMLERVRICWWWFTPCNPTCFSSLRETVSLPAGLRDAILALLKYSEVYHFIIKNYGCVSSRLKAFLLLYTAYQVLSSYLELLL